MKIPEWQDITVEMYQHIYGINKSDMSDIDKFLFTITFLTNKTEAEIDKISLRTYKSLEKQLVNIFTQLLEPKGEPSTELQGLEVIYDFKYMTLGRYIEIQHFIKSGMEVNLHMIGASITKGLTHSERADIISEGPFLPTMLSVAYFMKEFAKFTLQYKGLFGIDDDSDEVKPTGDFNERYGWIFSAKEVSIHEGIPLDAAFDLPVIQAFNDLAYLKSFQQYQNELNKKNEKL